MTASSLLTNGVGGLGVSSPSATSSAGLNLAPTAVKTANYTAAAGDLVLCNTSGGAFTVTLPTAPADKTTIAIKLTTAGNTLNLATGGSDVFNKAGGATTGTLSLLNQAIVLQYQASSAIWYVVTDDLPLSALDARYATSTPVALGIAVSDETTAITTGTAKATFRAPFAFSLTSVRASVNTVSSSGLPTVNVKLNGTTIFSTKVTIDATEKSSQTAATPSVLTTTPTAIADDDEFTVDIDVAGTGAKGLKIYLIGTKP